MIASLSQHLMVHKVDNITRIMLISIVFAVEAEVTEDVNLEVGDKNTVALEERGISAVAVSTWVAKSMLWSTTSICLLSVPGDQLLSSSWRRKMLISMMIQVSHIIAYLN